ncbi:MAG: hypothetical protein FJ095_18780 [Deltaproteobacteria bacterium]|nr:hypothetical protein [Deltaproteobacteria bacterium]
MAERRTVAALALVALAAPGCRTSGERATPLASAGSTSAASSGTPSALDPKAREKLELMRIAETRRGTELAVLAESDAPERTTALLALAYADDVELVLERISLIALDRRRPDRLEALEVLRDVAYRRPRDRERLAPESLAGCIVNLRRLAADERDEMPLRALATATVNAYVRGGYAASAPSPSSAPSPKTSASASAGARPDEP